MDINIEIAIRLLVSCFLGGIVGYQRERQGRPAGFRTHILVCSGSALIMAVSIFAFVDYTGTRDPGRIAAQVVSGIGFLGAGAIMREGLSIKGLTTAAGLWGVSGIGLAVGSGLYIPAILATILTVIVLDGGLEFRLFGYKHQIKILAEDCAGQFDLIDSKFREAGVSVQEVNIHSLGAGRVSIDCSIRIPKETNISTVIEKVAAVNGVHATEVIHG
jgi:Uncharacterized membrane protein